jgi:hypothetical protein
MATAWRSFLADWEDWRAQTTEIRALDSERVLALVNLCGRNRARWLELAQIGSTKGANLFHVLDGKVTKFVLYLDRDSALADLNLSPDAPLAHSPRARLDAWREVYEAWACDS